MAVVPIANENIRELEINARNILMEMALDEIRCCLTFLREDNDLEPFTEIAINNYIQNN